MGTPDERARDHDRDAAAVEYGPPSYPSLEQVRDDGGRHTVSRKVFVLPLIAVVVFVAGLIDGIVALTNALGDSGDDGGGLFGGTSEPVTC